MKKSDDALRGEAKQILRLCNEKGGKFVERGSILLLSLSQLWATKVRLSRKCFFAIDKLSEGAIGIVYTNRYRRKRCLAQYASNLEGNENQG
jgi:hypothetical protein